jgi:hypothetical protein
MVVVAAGQDEGGAGAAGGERETQHPAIEIERAREIRDLQMDMADAHPRVDGGQLKGLFFELDVGSDIALSLAGRGRP